MLPERFIFNLYDVFAGFFFGKNGFQKDRLSLSGRTCISRSLYHKVLPPAFLTLPISIIKVFFKVFFEH